MVRAAGEVSDYSDTVLRNIASSVASASGVDAQDVSITVTPASVVLSAAIRVAGARADSVLQSVTTKLGSADSASELLAVQVEAILTPPNVQASAPSSPPSPQALPGSDSSVIAAIMAGGVSVLAILLVIWRVRRRGQPHSKTVQAPAFAKQMRTNNL